MYRLIAELRPRCVICENVAGHVELGLDAVLADLESAGYDDQSVYGPAVVLLVCRVLQTKRRVRPGRQWPKLVARLGERKRSRTEAETDTTIRRSVLFD